MWTVLFDALFYCFYPTAAEGVHKIPPPPRASYVRVRASVVGTLFGPTQRQYQVPCVLVPGTVSCVYVYGMVGRG